MKRLMKYLLLFIVAATFWSSESNATSSHYAEDIADISFNGFVSQTSVSSPESQFNLPRQSSISSGPGVQGAIRRTQTAHRNNIEFTKSGKVFNAGLRYSVQLHSIIIHSTLVEPSRRLLCLGRLII